MREKKFLTYPQGFLPEDFGQEKNIMPFVFAGCIPVKFMKNFKSKMKQVDNSSWKFENKFVDWLEVECEGEKIKFIQIALF